MTTMAEGDQQTQAALVWRVYGIVPSDAAIPDFTDEGEGDLRSRELEVLPYGSVAAVVEPVDSERPARRKDLLAHSELLNALVEDVPVVPVAFGSAFGERDQVVEELLASQHDQLVSMLDQLSGFVQFLLRVRYSMDDLLAEIVAADPRIEALRDLTRDLPEEEGRSEKVQLGERVSRAVEDWMTADADWLVTQLAPQSTELRITGRSPAQPSMTLAFLVGQEQRQAFEAAAETCAERMHKQAQLALQGPLAAFDFLPEA